MSNLTENKELAKKFLELRPIDPQYKLPYGEKPFGFIYCIENKSNGMKYIGSARSVWTGIKNPAPDVALRKRVSQYLYEYNKYRNPDNQIPLDTVRPIMRAIVEEGIENFVMYPIAETSMATHTTAEEYFIKKYHTMKDGYNTHLMGESATRAGTPLTSSGKRLRGNPIIAIHMEDKKIITAESAKLFGDMLNIGKDVIKNHLRRGLPYLGWWIFYIDKQKRAEVMEEYFHPKNPHQVHGKSAKEFFVAINAAVDEYILNDGNPEFFPGFTKLPPLEYKE